MVFLISLKAGGFGLNLTEADYCFLLDLWWKPATEAQAVDRTHRIGQTRNVMVYRLSESNSIEAIAGTSALSPLVSSGVPGVVALENNMEGYSADCVKVQADYG